MSRVSWFAAGTVTGVYLILKARRTAQNLTPDGLAARAAALGAGFRVFSSEVSRGMAERESELRDQLALPHVGGSNAVPPMIEPRAREHWANPRDGREETPDGHR